MTSRFYIKRIWQVPKTRGPAEYLATLLVKALRKHGWPADWRPSQIDPYSFHLVHKFDPDPAPDFREAVSIAVRVSARAHRIDVTESDGFLTLNRAYRVTIPGGHFKELPMPVVIPPLAVELVATFEGFRSNAYLCPAGVWTIGYGTTTAAGVGIVVEEGVQISEPQARTYLWKALAKFGEKIAPKIAVETSEAEWAAILSLAYNIGPRAFSNSTVLRKLNAGDRRGAADAFLMWNKAKGRVLPGLVGRREHERATFLALPHGSKP